VPSPLYRDTEYFDFVAMSDRKIFEAKMLGGESMWEVLLSKCKTLIFLSPPPPGL
jgi:hypothetical protein